MSDLNIKIRRAVAKDAELLTELSYRTFYDAFHAHPKNAPEDLAAYMDEAFSLKTVSAELAADDSIFLIAEIEGEAAGYARILIGSIEDGITAERPCELNRLYSDQKFLGKGIGHRLIKECLQIARQKKCDVIWLGVWEYNPRAIGFYQKYDFRFVGRHIFQLGSDPQTDLLMQKDLKVGEL